MNLSPGMSPTISVDRGLPAGARALVVDDRRSCKFGNQALRPSLQSLGLEVFVAPTTDRAGRILNRFPIDLLLLDSCCLENPRGLDWLRSVRKKCADLELIVVAEQPSDELEGLCDALGAAAFLRMPVSQRTLQRCVERAFDGRRHLRQIQRLERRLAAAGALATQDVDESASCHHVDDLWFAIFEQLLGSAKNRAA